MGGPCARASVWSGRGVFPVIQPPSALCLGCWGYSGKWDVPFTPQGAWEQPGKEDPARGAVCRWLCSGLALLFTPLPSAAQGEAGCFL